MQDLKITFIQSNLHWENAEANRVMFSEKIRKISAVTDLILLPEMFSTGFTMKPEKVAEDMKGKTVSWMKDMASEKNCVIGGSVVIEENGKYRNRFIWMRSDGSYECYDKRHLFRYGNEQDHYMPGSKKMVVSLKGWNICPLICYDLRFPVWARNRWKKEGEQMKAEYDVLLYVANWPERRNHPWKILLQARAIENQAYVAGVNRVGEDASGIIHSGDSAIIDFKGELMTAANAHKDCVETVSLSYESLSAFRSSFPAGMDADAFMLD
ncbi:MAG TPA: amidohydrolase [Bacteroidia bacterium]|jgi:predicted amidohydrolase|nr:amidohydrolase [Bacteroidia bacterium]